MASFSCLLLLSFALFLLLPLPRFGFLFIGAAYQKSRADPRFDDKYHVTWGYNHVTTMDRGRQVQLSMDRSTGSGFESKMKYGSGFFDMQMKLPGRDSAGVVTAFYLASQGDRHDEADFEFLGDREGKPYTLQTNVFVDGVGNREQRVRLWFDPTTEFHSYRLLWNQHQIVFFVDNIPIRVFKNNTRLGVPYPTNAMQIVASLWDGSSWATDGGRTKTNWSYAPFRAQFRGFGIDGCEIKNDRYVRPCHSFRYWWNTRKFWWLDEARHSALARVRKNFMIYDYCTDKPRNPVPPPECRYNN